MPLQRGPFHETHAQPGERKCPAEFRTGTLRSEGARSDRRLNTASQGPGLALKPPVAATLPTPPSDAYGPPITNRWPVLCHAEVLSISAPVLDRFGSEIVALRRLARFRRAVDLIALGTSRPGHEIVALVEPELGNGPFHIVVRRLPPPSHPGSGQRSRDVPAWKTPMDLRIGHWSLTITARTTVWDPRPRWEDLRISEIALQQLGSLVTTAPQSAPHRQARAAAQALDSSLTQLVAALGRPTTGGSPDVAAISSAAGRMAGLGVGLTPSGDDVLAGIMLAMWAGHHPHRQPLCRAITQAAYPLTTSLSRAFLYAASEGLADERWHRLLDTLGLGPDGNLKRAVTDVLAHGATSGFDMLHGFIRGYEAVRRSL